ncbi:hypothetical protein BZG36_03754 [Bifiguratus adelaidae]|uniref:BHLH domain-containing protein n=1 Tax=Bifiguratus adelaidae TaxID=1938954 RepID=A0A261XY54_9FUNG|nr:hypothetical protein BZG36_03754 [Bifiguratus adelaidae]
METTPYNSNLTAQLRQGTNAITQQAIQQRAFVHINQLKSMKSPVVDMSTDSPQPSPALSSDFDLSDTISHRTINSPLDDTSPLLQQSTHGRSYPMESPAMESPMPPFMGGGEGLGVYTYSSIHPMDIEDRYHQPQHPSYAPDAFAPGSAPSMGLYSRRYMGSFGNAALMAGFPERSHSLEDEGFDLQVRYQTDMDRRRKRREAHNAGKSQGLPRGSMYSERIKPNTPILVERRRRDTINEKIQELGNLLPESPGDKNNKGVILRRTVDHLKNLTREKQMYEARVRELEKLLEQYVEPLQYMPTIV